MNQNLQADTPPPTNNPREEKWILWNMDRFGKKYDQHGNLVDDSHWIDRFKGWVWWQSLLLLLRLMNHEKSNEPTPFQGWFFYLIGFVVSSIPAAIAAIACLWLVGLLTVWAFLLDIAEQPAGRVVAFIILLAVGGAAYLLRRWFRSCYGGAELAFSFWAIWSGLAEAVSTAPDSTKVLISVVGGLYVMIRALDNIEQGWTEAGKIYAELRRRPTRKEIKVAVPSGPVP